MRAGAITESNLNFVDLAGSEKIGIHYQKNSGSGNIFNFNQTLQQNQIKDRISESKNINKSLFFLC